MPFIEEILGRPDTPQDFLCDPYIVRRGVTFLHGDTSIGKSPLTWELARCVSQGLPFFGYHTCPGRVLYLEADTAEPVLRPRLKQLPEPVGHWRMEFLNAVSLNLCDPTHKMFRVFAVLREEWDPDLVIWNTLKQFYQGSVSNDEIPVKVYKAVQVAFPHAGHLVNAHDRKQSTDVDAITVEREDFSGSKAWLDLATVGLHLIRRGSKLGPYLELVHTKSQVTEIVDPLKLVLDPDGTKITSLYGGRLEKIVAAMAEIEGTQRQKAEHAAAKLGLGLATVWRTLSRRDFNRGDSKSDSKKPANEIN